MKLNLEIGGSNFRLFAEATSLEEFTILRDYLKQQGLIGVNAPQTSGTVGEQQQAPQAAPKEAEAAPKEAEAAPKKEAPKKEAPKGNAKSELAKAVATAKTAAGPTIEEVTAALTEVADKFGVPEALLMNKRFGVKKAGELKVEQYADYLKFAKHVIADDVAPSAAHPDFDGEPAQAEADDVSNLV